MTCPACRCARHAAAKLWQARPVAFRPVRRPAGRWQSNRERGRTDEPEGEDDHDCQVRPQEAHLGKIFRRWRQKHGRKNRQGQSFSRGALLLLDGWGLACPDGETHGLYGKSGGRESGVGGSEPPGHAGVLGHHPRCTRLPSPRGGAVPTPRRSVPFSLSHRHIVLRRQRLLARLERLPADQVASRRPPAARQ
jgi:hypothetical protein